MFQPLNGVRVIDLTQVLAGPYAAYQLGLMGAEVIKIEAPGEGDWARHGGMLPDLNAKAMGLNYLTQNANKKSVALDLKSPQGLAIMQRLLATADVFIENFRPGAVSRLGLSFDAVRAIKPDIVYCSISAYGQDGEFSHRPAYDHVVQGMSGIMKTTGTEAGGPQKVGAPYVDYATGLNAAFAIVSGLHETRRTGKAVHLDVAMLDTSMLLMASLVTSHLSAGWMPKPAGNEAWSQSPSSGAFETADGLLMLAANNDKQYRALCNGIGRPDLLDDERWAQAPQRQLNAAALRSELVAIFRSNTALHWERLLDAAGVPAAKVRALDETLRERHCSQREFVRPLRLEGEPRELHLPTLGFKVDGKVVAPTSSPPTLGGDTQAVLRSLGYSDEEMRQFQDDAVFGVPEPSPATRP
ncbi:MAG: CoA transferase [Rhodoferax sp.]|jgi:crotonobetainyl-CoA:carnitine CoA-transferase CaiB-like acyl-CoA transferase|nr:CoA transferase [Rhodoferax sp.]